LDPTILLVDDLQMFLEIEKDFFRNAKVNIMTAKDGIEALALVKKGKPDLVFMDLQMPGMDGAACCRAIKGDPEHSRIPVVIISSSSGDKDKETSFAAGCNYFLTKPAGRDRFLEIAREFIPGIDRRESRLSCSFKGIILCNGESLHCSLHDLGADGAFVVTDFPGKPGNVITLSFALPDGAWVESPCKIVWVSDQSAGRPRGVGVRFALMAKEAKSALVQFIASQQKR